MYFTYPDDPEDDDDDDNICDCCTEYWPDCLCICSNCHGDYRVCRSRCYNVQVNTYIWASFASYITYLMYICSPSMKHNKDSIDMIEP